METSLDNEEKARQIRGTERESECITDPYGYIQSGLKGVSDERESLGGNRIDGPGRFDSGKPEKIIGKVVDQLINECISQLETKKQEIKQLEFRFSELEALRNELVANNNQDE